MDKSKNVMEVLSRTVKAMFVVGALMGAWAATGSMAAEPAGEVASAEQVATVNINTADAATLAESLDGIGEAKANAIVAWREQNGEFSSVDELSEVKGIGQATLDKNRHKLSL